MFLLVFCFGRYANQNDERLVVRISNVSKKRDRNKGMNFFCMRERT